MHAVPLIGRVTIPSFFQKKNVEPSHAEDGMNIDSASESKQPSQASEPTQPVQASEPRQSEADHAENEMDIVCKKQYRGLVER